MEKGRTIRVAATAVAANMHAPSDSTLLQDGIRVLTRLLLEGKTLQPVPTYLVVAHHRAVKRLVLEILPAKKEKVRLRAYRELLRLAEKVRGYGEEAITCLRAFEGMDRDQTLSARILAEELETMLSRFQKVLDQTRRRVVQGEQVPATAKILSLFECHADVMVKGNREAQFGHKVLVTVGRSGLILDCLVPRGNPADASLYPALLARQVDLYQRPRRPGGGGRRFCQPGESGHGQEPGRQGRQVRQETRPAPPGHG